MGCRSSRPVRTPLLFFTKIMKSDFISHLNFEIFFVFSTPLHIAAGEGHNDACEFLRNRMQEQSGRGVDPIGACAPVDLNGTTPVGWAAVRTRLVITDTSR